jgi:signal transduction histidine kinase
MPTDLLFLHQLQEACILANATSRQLFFANHSALKLLGVEELPQEAYLQDFLQPPSGARNVNHWRKGKQWFDLKEEKAQICGQTYILYTLRPNDPHIDPIWVQNAVELSEVMVHRLRSTLTGTMGFAELLGMHADLNEEAQSEQEAVTVGLRSMQKMLDELDRFRQLPEAEMQAVDVYSLAEGCVQTFRKMGEKRLQFHAEGESFESQADPKLLTELLECLLENAIDAIQSETDEIHLQLLGTTEIQVCNTGPLIPAADEKRIFHPFFTTKAQNLGLGLSRAALLARAMGMYVYLKTNSRESGVCFTLELQAG